MTWTDDMCQEEGRGLTSVKDSVDAPVQRLEDDIEKRGERLTTATRNNTDNTMSNRTKIIIKEKMRRKTTVWIFKRQAISHTRKLGRN